MAPRRLPEHLGQPDHRHRPRPDEVRQHLPRPHRRELIDVADEEDRRPVGHRAHQRLHQGDVDHRHLVDNQQIAVERLPGTAPEAAGRRIDLEQPVDGPRVEARRLPEATGRPARRGTEREGDSLDRQYAEDGVHEGRLPHAGAAGDDQHLGGERETDGGHLARGQGETDPPLDPGNRPLRVDRRPGKPRRRDRPDPRRDGALGLVQAGEEDARRLADPVRDEGAGGKLRLHGRLH